MKTLSTCLASLVIHLCVAAAASSQPQPFWVVELGGISGKLNNANQVLRPGFFGSTFHDMNTGQSYTLPMLPSDFNDLGQVVGTWNTSTGLTMPAMWSVATGMVDLRPAIGDSQVVAINNHGEILALSRDADGFPVRTFIYDLVSGASVDLPVEVTPIELNNNGQAVGALSAGEENWWETRVVVWDEAAGLTTIGFGWPTAINDSGQVVGYVTNTSTWNQDGFMWDKLRGRRVFTVAGGTNVHPSDINKHGYVIGTASFVDLDIGHVFVHNANGDDPTAEDIHPRVLDPNFPGQDIYFDGSGGISINDAFLATGALGSIGSKPRSMILRAADGAVQALAIKVAADPDGTFLFAGATSGAWFDPPAASGFDYAMESGSLFTAILDFPTGFNSPFSVVVDGCEIPGTFVAGDSVNFVARCGHGVTAFGIRGIDPARESPSPEFPIRLAFDTPTADFRMKAFIEGGTVDAAPPILTATRTAANEHGWNNGDVVVTFSCMDADSAIAIAPVSPVIVATEGAGQSVSASCTDAAGNESSLTVDGINIDKTAPVLACSTNTELLWPPNHQLIPIQATVEVNDAGSGPAGWMLLDVASDEDEGDDGDIEGWSLETADATGMFRAERHGGSDGREYTLRYGAADRAGNTATCSATVSVPHDRGR